MDTDLVLTIGVILLVLSVPSLLAAWAESRVPRMGSVLLIVAGAMILTALWVRPGGYAFSDVPGVMVGVVARLLN
jgi:formate-dependent nitrite reductase membrane component NrfD